MKFLHIILTALITQGNKSTVETPIITRTFPLLEAIFNDDLMSLNNLLVAGHEQNRNFGIGTAVDYAHLYGKYAALEILKRHGGKSGKVLDMPTPAMMYNPSPRRS